jgi:glycosyltransferase involved in cell wall biosynthesis
MKIAFLTNILTPYRVFFFDQIYKTLRKEKGDMRVFVMTDSLPLRPWSFHELKREYTILVKGIKFTLGSHQFMSNIVVKKQILSFSPDVLIVAGSWTYPTTWEVMLDKRITKNTKTLFWTESHNHTGIANSTKTKPAVRKIKQNLINRFDGFCLPGEYALETVSQIVDVNCKTIIRLPNLVDNEYYNEANSMRGRKDALRIEKGIPIDRFVFFTPARMRDLKGQLPFFRNVIDAVANKPVSFILAGEGPDKDAIKDIGTQNKMDIRIYDYQSQEQIREWLSLSDAFLLPSLSDPNPLSNIEAAWAGLPLCISCYVGNGPELVEDGVNGVIFDTLDRNSVCEKIEFVLNQEESWLEKAGRSSHQKAEEGFEAEKESVKFIKSLAEIRSEVIHR